MKKQAFGILLLIILLVTAACSEQSSGSKQPSGQPTPSITGGNTATEAAQTPSPTSSAKGLFSPEEDEICLTLMCSAFYLPSAEKVNALNWYLREQGYGFYVEAIQSSNYRDDGVDAINLAYQRILEARDAGTKVDLVMLGTKEEDAFDAVDQGVLLRLSPFLEQEGQDSWAAKVPQSYWESVKIGSGEKRDVYGLYSSQYGMISSIAIVVNEELFSAAGIALPEELSLDDLPTLLEELSNSEALENSNISAQVLASGMSWGGIWSLTGGYSPWYEVMLKWNGDAFESTNIFGEDEFIDAALLLYDLYRNGQLKVDAYAEESIPAGQFAVAVSVDAFFIRSFSKDSIYQQPGIRLYSKSECVSAMPTLLGIASWSEHPQEAYELLALLYSNEDVANLLYYGTTAENVEAGSCVRDGTSLLGLTNQLFLDHLLTDSEKEVYVKKLQETPAIPILYCEPILSGELEFAEWLESEERNIYGQDVDAVFDECETKEELLAYLKKNYDTLAESPWYPRMLESWNQQLAQE